MEKTMMERIQGIRNAAERMEQERQDALNAEVIRRTNILENLQSEYGKRICDLVTLAKELVANGIKLGKEIRDIIGTKSEFVTEGINHLLGFNVTYHGCVWMNDVADVIGIGIKGGGADHDDFLFDEFGTFKDRLKYIHQVSQFDFDNKVKRFTNQFDQFEQRVLAYIDSLN